MADQTQLEGMVQKLIAEGASDDDIRGVIKEYKGYEAAGEKANLGRVLGPKETTNFKLPSAQMNTPQMESTKTAPAQPRAIGRGGPGGYDVRKSDAWAKDNAPTIGAALATAAGPAGWPAAVMLAGAGGTGGALLRGDAPKDALWAGGKEAALEGGGRIVQGLSKIPYRAAIPKSVLDDFAEGGADIAKAGLENKVVLGTKAGVQDARQVAKSAANARMSAGAGVPDFNATDVRAAFRPKASEAVLGRRPKVVQDISDYVANSMTEIGPTPLSWRGQLARKNSLQQEGKAAMKAVNSSMAALNPQLANIEREAITKNLHSAPGMSKALKDAQDAVGLTRAARQTRNSSVFNRLGSGGMFNAARSPMGLTAGAIGAHTAANPQTLRLLDLLLSPVPDETKK